MLNEKIRLLRKSFTFTRFVNAIKVIVSYAISVVFKKSIYWGSPPIVMIEPTNICNLKCPLCPSGNGTLKREKGYMSFDVFKKVIDDVHKTAFLVVLWNQGESFLHKDFLKMINYASKKGLYTLASTNANIDVEAEKILDSGLDSLIISLDGITQETYSKYRVGGKVSEVFNNVKKLTKAKEHRQSKTPFLHWQFLVMKHNEHEISELRKTAKKLKIDQLELKSVQIYQKSDVNEFLPQNPKYRRYKVTGNDFVIKREIKNRCRRIWTNAVVNWNGDIAICCFDKDGEYPVGNVMNSDVTKLWKNSAITKIRNQILTDRKQIPICRNCMEGIRMRIEEKEV